MKDFKYWAIQVACFLFYTVVVYNLTIANLWLSIFMGMLMVSAFSSSNKLARVDEIIEKGILGAFKQNDELHNQHLRSIEDLNNEMAELKDKIFSLENKVEELENGR